jgi:hypothetical protein
MPLSVIRYRGVTCKGILGDWVENGMQCLARFGCCVECVRLTGCSATDVRVERRRNVDQLHHGEAATSSGKLASPCGAPARVQRGPGPPLLPGKVRSSGSDRWVQPVSLEIVRLFMRFLGPEGSLLCLPILYWTTELIILDLIRIIFVEECQIWGSLFYNLVELLRNFLLSPVTRFLLGIIFSSAPCSQAFTICVILPQGKTPGFRLLQNKRLIII